MALLLFGRCDLIHARVPVFTVVRPSCVCLFPKCTKYCIVKQCINFRCMFICKTMDIYIYIYVCDSYNQLRPIGNVSARWNHFEIEICCLIVCGLCVVGAVHGIFVHFELKWDCSGINAFSARRQWISILFNNTVFPLSFWVKLGRTFCIHNG